jgi:hypothetical protein
VNDIDSFTQGSTKGGKAKADEDSPKGPGIQTRIVVHRNDVSCDFSLVLKHNLVCVIFVGGGLDIPLEVRFLLHVEGYLVGGTRNPAHSSHDLREGTTEQGIENTLYLSDT